jgi:hypothetical protein
MTLQELFNLPHQHLLLNHSPIIGSFIGLGLFIVALISKEDLKKASLGTAPPSRSAPFPRTQRPRGLRGDSE